MRRSAVWPARVVLPVLCSCLGLSSPLLAQRSDRAIIGGVVTDDQGSAVPAATVTVRNDATGVETNLVTNSAGAYTTAPLVLGTYTVSVNLTGFKKAVATGIVLRPGDVVRHDVVLQVGALTESIEVSGADVEVTRPDVTHSVNEKYYKDLPIVTAGDVRLAESVLLMQPGYLPMAPNGDPMFRGSQFNSRINGGQARAVENFFDGGAFGYASGHQGSQESTPPVEAIQEVTVITTTYSAQYGHTSGGFIEYTSKSGTNKLRGSAYTYIADDKFNSQGYFKLPKTPLDNRNYGATLGGPIFKNKTFFFVNADLTQFRSGTLEGFGNTTPIDAFKAGDFSALLTGNQIGTDILGRPIFGGQIFNPATTRIVNGVPVRDPYPGNIIPGNDPLRSIVAARYAALMVHPDRPGLQNNVAGNPAGDQTWEIDARNILLRLDHSFSDRFKATFSGYYNNRPSLRNCGGAQGCDVPNDPLTDSASNTEYIGEGFTQRIYTSHAHTQWDWIISNNLMSHSVVAWDRWYMGGASLSAGANWPERLWGSQQRSGLVIGDAGPPRMAFNGNIPYNAVGQDWPSFGFEKNDRWQFSTDLAWIKGRGTYKVGMEYRKHKFPHQGWATGGAAGNHDFNRLGTGGYDAAGNSLSQTGDPFASFLLGQVHAANQAIYAQTTWFESYFSPWINAEFKLNSKLTLNAGLRLDYQGARTEEDDQYSTFDPNTPNPGAGGRPGAMIFAGDGAGRTGSRTFERPKWDSWGPRAGFAYRVSDKTMVRGGYGMYYAGVAFSQFTGDPNLGFASNPSAPNTTNGLFPAYHLDQGFPQNRIVRPPFIDPTVGLGGGVPAVAPDGLTLPRFQNWSVTVERRLTKNMMLDVSYIGNRGSRLNHHGQRAGLDYNMNDPRVLSLGAALLNSNINSPAARNAGIAIPYTGFNGTVAQALRKYPQYQNIEWRGLPLGRSQYHALELVLEQRFSAGLQYRLGYTFSRLENNGAESGQGNEGLNGEVQDPVNWDEADWGLSADDTPHVFLAGFSWDVAQGRWGSWSGAKKALLGGWNVSGVFRYESGRPLRINMANDMAGLLFNTRKRPNRTGADGVAAGGDFNPLTDNYFNRDAWQDPGPLTFGNAPRADGSVRSFRVYNEDVTLSKNFDLKGDLKMRFVAQVGNILNRTTFCNPNTNFSSSAFGQVSTQCNQARSVQFGLRLDY
jgi:carboxypeptidase family protein